MYPYQPKKSVTNCRYWRPKINSCGTYFKTNFTFFSRVFSNPNNTWYCTISPSLNYCSIK